jgi:hypothetical protein
MDNDNAGYGDGAVAEVEGDRRFLSIITGETKNREPLRTLRMPSVIMSFGSMELEIGIEIPIGMDGVAVGEEKSEKGILID